MMKSHDFRPCGLALTLVASCLLAGCTPSSTDQPVEPTPQKKPVDVHARFVTKLMESDVDGLLRAYADTGASSRRLKVYLSHEVKKGWRQRVRGGIKYADLFETLYSAREYRKVVSSFDGINARGREIYEILKKSPEHVLKTKYYSISRIAELDAVVSKRAAKTGKWKTIKLTDSEQKLLISWLKEHKVDVTHPDTQDRVLRILAGVPPKKKEASKKPAPKSTPTPDLKSGPDKQKAPEDKVKNAASPATPGTKKQPDKTAVKPKDTPPSPPSAPQEILPSPIPRITAQVRLFQKAMDANAKDGAELELRLIDATLRYARDMKHFNLTGISWRAMKKAGGSKKLIYDRLAVVFKDVVKATPKTVSAVMRDLEPRHPQYARLLKLRKHYLALKKANGWPRVAPVYVRKGKKSPAVAKLRKRLWMEGYLTKPIALMSEEEVANMLATPPVMSDVVDEALIKAVKLYRETHQLKLKGPPGRIFWKSLNVPVGRRLEQIETNIKRLRSSMYNGETDYLLVNLPEFYGESYIGNKLKHRFKVVVGKNNRVCDPKKARWVFPNATPLLASKMEYFVLNPAWFVPDRIVREEIIPFMEEEGWMERKGYKIVKKKGDSYEVRQDPGPNNALGLVKFIFPNPHNTYMHDTPRKQYFKMNIRAQSHGCMRVNEPLDLARHLVKTQSLGEKYDVNAIIKSKEPKSVRLKKALPVFVEYMTVRTNNDGYQQFFIDIYYRDRLEQAGKKDFGPCTPPPQPDEKDKKESADIGP